MAESSPVPQVDVAVALIRRGEHLLAVYNPQWGAFTLPMTKRRSWQDPSLPGSRRDEEWRHAAARAATEFLGRTLTNLVPVPVKVAPYQQSDRTGEWKRFHFEVFQLVLESDEGPGEGMRTEWLTRDQFLDEAREPISPTARHVLRALCEAEHLGSAQK